MWRGRVDFKLILVMLAVLSLPVLSLNLQKPGENPWVLRPFSFVTGFLQESFIDFVAGVRGSTRTYLQLIGIQKQIRQLQEENAQLKAKLLNFDDLKLENQRYRDLMQFADTDAMELLPARVIGQDLFAERSVLRISVGSLQGVQKGQAVIHPNGVVGYVLSANLTSSVILLLTDRYAVVDARLQRSRARGIVKGLNPTQVELLYLQRTDEVEIGDLVVSSGLDNIFPEGFPIGRVDSVHKESAGITQEVILRPMVETSQLQEVFVIKKILRQNSLDDEVEDLTQNQQGQR